MSHIVHLYKFNYPSGFFVTNYIDINSASIKKSYNFSPKISQIYSTNTFVMILNCMHKAHWLTQFCQDRDRNWLIYKLALFIACIKKTHNIF